uniref:HMA domain-containing protein n=1 Tax=Opuntia streptacantha TaxID=393608 RepID=A0A7C8YRT4_OPUST
MRIEENIANETSQTKSMGEGEEKKAEGGECANNGSEDEIVLKVDMHCEACAKKVSRVLRSFPGGCETPRIGSESYVYSPLIEMLSNLVITTVNKAIHDQCVRNSI